MISQVIAIGLSLNVLILLCLWSSRKTASEILTRLRNATCPSLSAKQKVYLTGGLIEQYEMKLTALENQPSVSVLCPFPVNDRNHAKGSVSATNSFGHVKKMLSKFTRNVAEQNVQVLNNKLERNAPSNFLSSTKVVPASFESTEDTDHVFGEHSSFKRKQLVPTVPNSFESEKGKPTFFNFEHFRKSTERLTESEKKSNLLKKAIEQSNLTPNTQITQPRSKLAIRLGRKLETLSCKLALVQHICKQSVINFKLDKLNRMSAKKAISKGRTPLHIIIEEGETFV